MTVPTHANYSRALGQHIDSVWSHHFDLRRDTEHEHTARSMRRLHNTTCGCIALQATARAQRSSAPDRPADSLQVCSDTRTTVPGCSADSERSSGSDVPRREQHRRMRGRTATQGEWQRMARAQTLVRSGGSGSAHHSMRNAASRSSSETALDDVDARDVQRAVVQRRREAPGRR